MRCVPVVAWRCISWLSSLSVTVCPTVLLELTFPEEGSTEEFATQIINSWEYAKTLRVKEVQIHRCFCCPCCMMVWELLCFKLPQLYLSFPFQSILNIINVLKWAQNFRYKRSTNIQNILLHPSTYFYIASKSSKSSKLAKKIIKWNIFTWYKDNFFSVYIFKISQQPRIRWIVSIVTVTRMNT